MCCVKLKENNHASLHSHGSFHSIVLFLFTFTHIPFHQSLHLYFMVLCLGESGYRGSLMVVLPVVPDT